MLVSTLITRVREDYLDDTLGVDEGDSLVSAAALVRFASEAQEQACRRHELIYDESTSDVCNIPIIGGIADYAFHPKITRIERVSHNGVDLYRVYERELNARDPQWRVREDGTPTCYYVRNRKIHLFPTPDPGAVADSNTVDLAVYRKPLFPIRSKSQSFEIFEEAQDDLIYWMLYRVYNLRDEDLNDPNAAAMYLSLFQETFGPVIPIDVRTHQLESPERQRLRAATGYIFSGDSAVDPDFDSSGWS